MRERHVLLLHLAPSLSLSAKNKTHLKHQVSSEYQGTLHNQLFGYKAKLIEGKYNIIIAVVRLVSFFVENIIERAR